MTEEIRKQIKQINVSQRGLHAPIIRALEAICDKIDEIDKVVFMVSKEKKETKTYYKKGEAKK